MSSRDRCRAAWRVAAFVLASLVPCSAAAAPPRTGADVAAQVGRLLTQQLDASHTARVTGLALSRGAARLEFRDGVLARGTDRDGTLQVAAFAGHGTFRFTPPSAFEQAELDRFFHTRALELEFAAVVLVWADSTLEELDRSLTWGPGELPARAVEQLTWLLKSTGGHERGLSWPWSDALLAGGRTGFFHAYVLADGDRGVFFEIDPTAYEDQSLWRVPPRHFLTAASIEDRDLVCRFASEPRRDTLALGDERATIAVRHTRIDAAFTGTLRFTATADLTVEPRETAEWYALVLHKVFDVDSVLWDGAPAASSYRSTGPMLLVRPRELPLPGSRHALRIVYHGPLIDGVGDWLLPRTWSNWYPRPLHRDFSTFDLTFHAPEEFLVTSIGELDSSVTSAGVHTTHWTMRRPTENATFVIGRFEERATGGDDIPPVRGLFYSGKPQKIRWVGEGVDGRTATFDEGERMEPWVIEDVAKCVAFYQQWLGPAPVPSFVVSQIPSLRGEAFPGLVNIPPIPYADPVPEAQDLVFRAHEVAHQWWGYGVVGRDYHEHWLNEGFANYSGLLYLQKGAGHAADALTILGDWRDRLFQDAGTRPEGGRPAGPLWLGTRNSTVDRPGDARLVDYLKGAWVLQMLRCLLMDMDSMDDARFMAVLRDFYRESATRGYATTADLQRIAERESGLDLGWFFDEWVYGTDLPTYRFSYRIERAATGANVVHCRVRRTDANRPFKTAVILRVDFGRDRLAWVRRLIEAPETEFDLPPFDETPVGVVFGDLQSLLCRSQTVDWK